MLRRSIVQFASRSRVPLQTTTQRSSYLSSRGAFYVSKNEPHKPDPGSSAPESQSRLLKIIAGGITLGFAYLTGYCYDALYTYLEEDRKRTSEYAKALTDNKNIEASTKIKTDNLACESSTEIANSDAECTKLDTEIHSSGSIPEDSIITEEDESYQAKDIAAVEPEKNDHVPSDDLTSKPAEESLDPKSPEVKPDVEHHKAIETAVTLTAEYKSPAEIETNTVPRKQSTTEDMPQGDGTNRPSSLLDDYNLRDIFEELAISSSDKHKVISSNTKGLDDGYLTKDGKLVLDFLQAIHAAEERQAELDASFFFKEMKAMKEKYEKELKDARVRELMYAERESILDKELNRERVKAAAALKSLQEKLEEKLKAELEQKETEVEQTLKKMQDIAKAELTAAIASEKASQIEKMAEANLHINALCMAFYARSEESRQSHSVHKLALGALALEYALSKGLPIKKEIEALHTYVEGIDKDSLVAVVLSSLPEDTQKNGTDTPSQLNHKFDVLKGTLRHFSLIPPGGGGILAHSLAHVASWLKVKESDQSGDGIESLINRVESLLGAGKLHEAADTLENGVKGSQAAEIVDDWVRRAKNRAITEQALTVLKSYATSISIP